jgi:hypothetical protein
MRANCDVSYNRRMSFNFFRFGGALAMLASLALVGCGNHAASTGVGSSALLPAAGVAAAADTPTTVYVSDFEANAINMYSDGGRTLAGTIRASALEYAEGLAVDGATSSLYAATEYTTEVFPGSNGRVREYPGGVVLPIAGYDWSWYQLRKSDPDVSSLIHYNVVAGNWVYSGANFAPLTTAGHIGSAIGRFPLYSQPSDALAPSQRTFKTPQYYCIAQMMADGQGNLYVLFVYVCGNSSPFVYQLREYAPGKSDARLLPLPEAVRHTIGAMALDDKGDLVACDEEHLVIYVYPPGKTTPSRSFSKGLKGCRGMVFGAGYKSLYVIDQPLVQQSLGTPGVVDVFDYASGRKQYTITQGLNPATSIPDGIAVDPPAQPGLPYH